MRNKPVEGDLLQLESWDQTQWKITFLTPATTQEPSKIIGLQIFILREPESTQKLLAMFGLSEGPEIIPRLYVLVKNKG